MPFDGAQIHVMTVLVELLRRWRAPLVALLCALVSGWAAAAANWGQATAAGFNHGSTGYALTGTHAEQSCEACHIGGRMKGTPRTCASCHTAGNALSQSNVVMPQRHVPAVLGCGECHTTQSFARTKFRHSNVTMVSCQTCHTGLAATGKTPRHVLTASNVSCGACHSSTTSWLPTTFNHTQVVVAGRCFSCHDGTRDGGTGRPATHVPGLFILNEGINDCDSCHLDGFNFRDWVPARAHQFTKITSQCSTCHTGAFPPAVAQPRTPSHVGASPLCETCHTNTRLWLDVDLSKVASLGGNAKARVAGARSALVQTKAPLAAAAAVLAATVPPPRHIPLPGGTVCTACHRSARDMVAAVVMNHKVVSTVDCKACHSGAYMAKGAISTPAAHIPYKTMLLNGSAMDCDDCHKGFTGANWSAVKMNHNSSVGGGAGLCKGCHQQGTAFLGQMEKKSLAHAGSKGKMAGDCSSAGCHGPLGGNSAKRFSTW